MQKASISILLLVRDKEKSVAALLDSCFKTLRTFGDRGEVILIDDGSKDKTLGIAEDIATRQPGLRVISNSRQLGYPGGLIGGFRLASNDWCFCLPGTGEFPPSLLGSFIANSENADIVISDSRSEQTGFLTRIWSQFLHIGTKLVLGLDVATFASPSLYRKKTVTAALGNLNSWRRFWPRWTLFRVLRRGRSVKQIDLPGDLSPFIENSIRFEKELIIRWKNILFLPVVIGSLTLAAWLAWHQKMSFYSFIGGCLALNIFFIWAGLVPGRLKDSGTVSKRKKIGRWKLRALGVLTVTGCTYILVWKSWIEGRYFLWTLLAILIAVVIVAWLQGGGSGTIEKGSFPLGEASREIREGGTHENLIFVIFSGLFLWAIYCSTLGALSDDWPKTGGFVLLAYVVWRLAGPGPGPLRMPRWIEVSTISTIMIVGTVFRIYQLGDIPVGMHVPDEKLIYDYSRAIVEGWRPTIVDKPGYIGTSLPFYLPAFFIKCFGFGLWGFRLGAAVAGLFLVFFVYVLARNLLGPSTALFSAGFAAVELYSVGMDRMQYLLMGTPLLPLVSLTCLVLALQSKSQYLFAASGIFFGASLQDYIPSYGIIVLLPLFVFLFCLIWRTPLIGTGRGWVTLFLTTAMTLSPLVLEVARDPVRQLSKVFSFIVVGASWMTPPVFYEDVGILQKINGLVDQGLTYWPTMLSAFTTRGPHSVWQFLDSTPVISSLTLFFVLAGLASSLVKFRSPAYLYLPMWFFIGLLPGILTAPGTIPDVRRAVMAMPPLFILAGVGAEALIGGLTGIFTGRLRLVIALSLGVGAMSFIGKRTWHDYFHVINESVFYFDKTEANQVRVARAVHEENKMKAVYVLSYKHHNQKNLTAPLGLHHDWSMRALNPTVPYVSLRYPSGTSYRRGILEALDVWGRKYGEERDAMVILSSYYFYLESLLTEELGGRTVRELLVAGGPAEHSRVGAGLLPPGKILAKLIRLPKLNKQKLTEVIDSASLPAIFEELQPPAEMATIPEIHRLGTMALKTRDLIQAYLEKPKAWRVTKVEKLWAPDVYFWTLRDFLPGKIKQPYRMRCHWNLEVPQDGRYTFGLNASIYTSVKVDGKKVQTFWLDSVETLILAQRGIFGETIFLNKGSHLLEIEQVMLNFIPTILIEFRLLWKTPSGEQGPVPIALLSAGEEDHF